jgi:hypothetical protein
MFKRIGLPSIAAATVALVALSAFSQNADDRAVAEQALASIPAPIAQGPAQDYVKRAKASLERATRLRAARDDARARLAEQVAREWAEAAKDLAASVEAEDRAAQARRDEADAGAQVDRERALLEEGIAQSGRLRAQLEALEREKAGKPAAAPGDAGAPRAAPRRAARAADGGAK